MKNPLGILVKDIVRKQQYGHRKVDTAAFSCFLSLMNRTGVLTAELFFQVNILLQVNCNLFLLMEFYMLTGINQSMKTGMKNRRPKGMIQGQEQLSKLRNKNQVVITTKKTCFNHIKLLVCQRNTLAYSFHYERKFILNTNGNNIFADKKHALLIAVYLNSKNFVENSYFNEHES